MEKKWPKRFYTLYTLIVSETIYFTEIILIGTFINFHGNISSYFFKTYLKEMQTYRHLEKDPVSLDYECGVCWNPVTRSLRAMTYEHFQKM